jgi:potassium-transporting ATPase KdpC subunit
MPVSANRPAASDAHVFSIALRATLFTLLLTGLAYPFLVTGLAQILFPGRANGSLVFDERGQVVGSALIGQGFSSAAYFQSRPSAAGDKGWDATASGGSNLGPTSQKLHDRVADSVKQLQKDNPSASGLVPPDLVFTSASGLDPEIAPEAALWQVPRVAQSRGLSASRVQQVVQAGIEGRDLGFLGEPRVNVLLLNLAIDRQFGKPPPTAR